MVKQTIVTLYKRGEYDVVSNLYEREYFRSITVKKSPEAVWKALRHGMEALYGIDITHLRAIRKRKGGKSNGIFNKKF